MLTQSERSQRARVAALKRHHGNSELYASEARDFKTARLAVYIAHTVDAAPALTDAQRDRLAQLLRPASGNAQ